MFAESSTPSLIGMRTFLRTSTSKVAALSSAVTTDAQQSNRANREIRQRVVFFFIRDSPYDENSIQGHPDAAFYHICISLQKPNGKAGHIFAKHF
jgi:hypothetical protein